MVSDMSSLMELVSQNQPHFKTHHALLVIGLQNDFVLPDGRLPVNVKKGFLERIQTLIPKFRELNGNVIWVQTLYEADRIATDANTGEGDALVVGGLIDGDESSTEGGEDELTKEAKDSPSTPSRSAKHKQRALDLLKRVSARRKTIPQEVAKASAEEDDELFLLKSEKKSPACVPNTFGAEFADVIARQFELPADAVIKTTNYSAFQGTSLLMTLRARLVTELYICGCITNISVLATVIDAARHGIKINVVQDCLGYRKQSRHDLALKRMDEFFDAYLIDSSDILSKEAPASPPPKRSSSPSGARKGSRSSDKAVDALAGKMSSNEEGRPTSRTSNPKSPTRVLSGKPRTLSLVSAAGSRKTNNSMSEQVTVPIVERTPEPTDKQFTDMLVKGAIVPGAKDDDQDQEKPNLVKTKIRMRSNHKKKKKKDKEKEREGESSKGEAVSTKAETTEAVSAKSPQAPTEVQRMSKISKAESTANLREKEIRQQALKSVASVPVLSAKTEEKERNRLSDLSDRVRMSLSRATKTDSAADSKRGSYSGSLKATPTPPPVEEKTPKPVPTKLQESTTSSIPAPAQAPIQVTQTSSDADKNTGATMAPSAVSTSVKATKLQSLATLPVLGPGDKIAEGDSRIIYDFFADDLRHPSNPSQPLKDLIFTQVYNEVRWQKMLHQQGEVPRLVCCQGEFGDDGSMPVYRHPSDQSLPLLHFSPKVQVIRRQAEKLVGHPLNHVLIQLYRSGNDYISEHSDKTLDIVKGSSIVNVSFGAQRTMRLRTKKSAGEPEEPADDGKTRKTERVAMPHNSMFVLGLESNAKWLHGIMADKRIPAERSAEEMAYCGMRISLTFRQIGTFIDARESTIWGQGATAKAQRNAVDVINGDEDEAERMVRAFSRENHSTDFDWEEHYGAGFDVLHLHSAPPPQQPLLFASNNPIETAQAQICLNEAKVQYTLIAPPDLNETYELDRQVAYRDVDAQHTEVVMSSVILPYLDRYHPVDTSPHSHALTAAAYPVMLVAAGIMKAWQNRGVPTYAAQLADLVANLEDQVATRGGAWIAGNRFSMADGFVWPITDVLVREWDKWTEEDMPKLSEWYKSVWRKKVGVRKAYESVGEVRSKKKAEVQDEAKKVEAGKEGEKEGKKDDEGKKI